jgi:5,10-methylenetetrahydrofolate reductase
VLQGKQSFQLSVELEPPSLYHPSYTLETLVDLFLEKILELANFTDWISITNRHTYHMSSMTAVKKAISLLRKNSNTNVNMAMHLTTRHDERTTYKQVLDSQAMGLRYLMPLLGDPRGPKNVPSYFSNAIDLLRYVSYLATGDETKLQQMGKRFEKLVVGKAKAPDRTSIKENFFEIGTVLDPNPIRVLGGYDIPIREKEKIVYPKKINAGATYFMTQAIFEAEDYFTFLDELNNPKDPIGIGLIPARLGLTERIGVPMPKEQYKRLTNLQHDRKAQLKEGNQITHEIFNDLRYRGGKNVNWIHIYSFGSLNNVYEIIGEELQVLSESIQRRKKRTSSIFLRSL